MAILPTWHHDFLSAFRHLGNQPPIHSYTHPRASHGGNTIAVRRRGARHEQLAIVDRQTEDEVHQYAAGPICCLPHQHRKDATATTSGILSDARSYWPNCIRVSYFIHEDLFSNQLLRHLPLLPAKAAFKLCLQFLYSSSTTEK